MSDEIKRYRTTSLSYDGNPELMNLDPDELLLPNLRQLTTTLTKRRLNRHQARDDIIDRDFLTVLKRRGAVS